jgi:uncharacterized membrane protein YraQ (UPF0718 family)
MASGRPAGRPAARRRPILDAQFVGILAVALALAALAFWRGGAQLVRAGLDEGASQLLRYGALIAVSFLAAGFAQVLMPREWVQAALGQDSGLRGIVLASAAGIATPAGPFVSLPIAATLLGAGADQPAVIAYLSAWSLLALHRLVAWEVPILGARFALVRYAICIALPILAGLLARGLGRLL